MSIAPPPPTDVHAVVDGMNVLLYWKAPEFNGTISQYRIFRYPDNVQFIVSGDVRVAKIGDLWKDTAYYFGVVAINQNQSSILSTVSETVIPRQTINSYSPMVLTTQPGNQSAALFWQSPVYGSNPPITQYLVTQYPDDIQRLLEQAETFYVWNGLVNGKTYSFIVKAYNYPYYENYSAISNSILPRSVPFPPTTVVAVPSSASAIIYWDKPENVGGSPIYQYKVISFPEGWSVITPEISMVAKVYGLKLNVPYYFVVVATNLVGDSIYSLPSNTIICKESNIPQPPVNVTAISQSKSALITWDAPIDTGGIPLTGYIITRSPDGDSVVLSSPYATSYVWSNNIILGRTYTFSIRATNSLGNSDSSLESNPVVIVTVPDPPTNVRIQMSVDKQSVLVEWDPSLTFENYEVLRYTVVSSPGNITKVVYRDAQGFINLYTVVEGLDPTVAYQFYVKATNAVGDSSFSEPSPISQIINNYNLPQYKKLKTGGNDPTITRRQLYARIIRGKYNRNQYVNTGGGSAYMS